MLNPTTAERPAHRGLWLIGLVAALAVMVAMAFAQSAHAGGNPCEDIAAAGADQCECEVTLQSSDSGDCEPNPCDVTVQSSDGGDNGYDGYCECVYPERSTADAENGEYNGVCKTAYGKWTKKIEWKVDKKILDRDGKPVDRQHVDLFYGDSYWANYAIQLRKRIVDVYSVHGKIYVDLGRHNNGVSEGPVYMEDRITSLGYDVVVRPEIRCKNGDSGWGPVPETVRYEGVLECEYWAQVPKPTAGKNTVDVWIGDYQEPDTAYAEFDFPDRPSDYRGPKQIWLQDTNFEGAPIRGPFEESNRFHYKKHFECNKDENPYVNTNTVRILVPDRGYDDVTIADAEYKAIGEDMARLRIECHGLDVKKTAKGKFDRTFKWKIKKYASHKQVVLARKIGDPKKSYNNNQLARFAKEANVKYTVKVESYPEDHDFRAKGKIEITNKHPKRAAHILGVKDIIDPDGDKIRANVKCEGEDAKKLEFPISLPAGETLTCKWSSDLPDNAERKNVAKAEIQNYHYEVVKTDNPGWHVKETPEGTTKFKGGAPITFGDPKNVYDEMAHVYDTLAPKKYLGRVKYDETPKKFHYYVLVKPGGHAPLCGKGSLYNKASLVTNDSETRLYASRTIPILVKCFEPAPPKKDDPPKKGDGGKKPPPVDDGKKDPPPPPPPPPPVDDKKDYEPPKDKPDHGSCVPKKGKPWHLIGPDGKKTEFYESGMTYKQVMRKGLRGKNPHYRFARAYIIVKLYILGGADYGKKVGASMRWAERYLTSYGPNDTNVKRALNAKKAKKLRKAVNRKKRVLIRYAKHAHMPRCTVA